MEYVWLCLSAIAAGAVNAVAGGGTLLTFPVLANVVPAHIANGTSTVALFPGSFASVWGYRARLAACRKWIAWLTAPSVVGSVIGASLVREESFKRVIPYLILTAAVLFLLQPTIARLLKKSTAPPRGEGAEVAPKVLAAIVAMQFLIGIYGGYFGAGIGILMLSTLSFLGLEDIHHVNALKTFLAFWMNIVAAVVFIVNDMVAWQYAPAMAIASIIGGYLGARGSLLLKPVMVRWIVIVIGFGLAAYYFLV